MKNKKKRIWSVFLIMVLLITVLASVFVAKGNEMNYAVLKENAQVSKDSDEGRGFERGDGAETSRHL